MKNWIETFEGILVQYDVGDVSRDVSLKEFTTWKIGGPAKYLVEPRNTEQLSLLYKIIQENDIPYFVLSAGSNILVNDEGVNGVVILIRHYFSKIEVIGDVVNVQAGAWVPRIALTVSHASLSGMEHAAGIPGSIGGLIYMNGGSLRRSISDSIISVATIDVTGSYRLLTNSECEFSYRGSIFQRSNLLILSADLQLAQGNRSSIRKSMLKILRDRRHKFPLKMPNCGSVFLSSTNNYSAHGAPGKIIEDLGLKGVMVGGAQVSQKHANFIVNVQSATAENVISLIKIIKKKAKSKLNIDLPCEVKYLNEECRVSQLVEGDD